MKKQHLILLVLVLGLGWWGTTHPATAQSGTFFEKLKGLAGEWEGQTPGEPSVKASYLVVSNGSAVLETVQPAAEPSMITVYHMDKDALRMTHYCGSQNQPRMKAISVSPDGKVASFELTDITNLAKPTDGHMKNLEITFLDLDHIIQKWTWVENGQKRDYVFHLTRLK